MSTPADRLVLRRATLDDAPSLAAQMAHPDVQPGLLQLPYVDVEAWRRRLSTAPTPGSHDIMLVGVLDGEIVANGGLFTERPVVRRRHAVSLGLSVAAGHQGEGLGSKLLEALIDYADRWTQILRIELTVYADNERAIALYRRHGFELEGRHRAHALRDGRFVDSLSMARLHPNPPRWD